MINYKYLPALFIVIAMSFNTIGMAQECTPPDSISLSSYRMDKLNENQHHIHTEILIKASTSQVWEILSDFENMPKWSSTLQGISGTIENGGQTTVTYKFPDRTVNIPHILTYIEKIGFGWSAPLDFAPHISDNHLFEI